MRLIDADHFLNFIKSEMKQDRPDDMHLSNIIRVLEDLPTVYDIDKVVEELEEKQQKWKTKLSESDTNYMDNAILKQYISHYDKAIEIVKRGVN